MFIFLFGEDTYRLQKKLNEIQNEYKKVHKNELNLRRIDVSKIEFEEFVDELFQRSMFVKRKLFLLENLFSNEKFQKDLIRKIKGIAKSEDLVVIFEKDKISKKNKLFLALKKYAQCEEFKPLKETELQRWIKDELKKYKIGISYEATNLILEFIGNDLWQISNEIKKLVCLKESVKEKEINTQDIKNIVRPNLETNIFEIINSLAQKDKKKALRLIQIGMGKGDMPIDILRMINYQFRALLIAKALADEGKGLNDFFQLNIFKPYPARKAWQASAGFSLNELKKIYQKIFEADLDMKTKNIQKEEILKMLVIDI
jgi:DNA polymerase-3 subunit delta